jgi:NADPH2:quinone reductase
MDDLSSKVMPLFNSGTLKPIIYKVLSFEEYEKAHSIMESDENIGKIILNLD